MGRAPGTHSRGSSHADDPGNTDSTCPSGPTPRITRSSTGRPSLPVGTESPSSRAYRSAAQAGPSPRVIASPAGIGWRVSGGSPSEAIGTTLDSGWFAGTNRSSPHQVWTRDQSTASDSGGSPSAR